MARYLAPLLISLIALPASARADEASSLDLTSAATAEPSGGTNSGDVVVPSTASVHHTSVSNGSLLAGKTLGGGQALLIEFGWPGILVTYLQARTSTLDIGGTFTFNYGREGLVEIDPGIKLAGTVRLNLYDSGKLNLGLRFDPGVAMYFSEPDGEGFAFGLALPSELRLGISAGDALMLHFGFELPLLVRIVPTQFFRVEIPFLFGAGMEYRVDSHLSLTFDCGFGPDVLAYTDHTETDFAFKTLLGIGYRL